MLCELTFRLLGGLEVLHHGTTMPLTASKLRVLLATLLVAPNRTVAVDTIVERLWGEDAPSSSRSAVHTYVTRLRRSLGDDAGEPRLLHTRPAGYLLQVKPEQVDLMSFRDLLERAGRAGADGDPVNESALLGDALDLWRGPALLGIASDSLQRDVVPRLTEEYLQAVERRLEVDLALGRHQDRLGQLTELVREYPLRERFHGLLMQALYRSDRQAEALEAYRSVQQLLRTELGLDPGEQLQRLHKAVLSGDAVVDSPHGERLPSPHRVDVTPCQLPANIGGFIGRAGLIEELTRLMAGGYDETSNPVIMLSGPPGVGKTALALHVGHRLREQYPEGQLYVDLQGYSLDPPLTPTSALTRFLPALGVPANQVPTDEHDQAALYRSLLAGRRVLVVLDNAGAAQQVRPLLPGQPGCAVLVTSRDDLRGLVALDGGHPIPLTALDVQESRTVLTGILGTTRAAAEPEALTELGAECAHLPLALRIAAANLRANPHRSIADYTDELRKGGRLAGLRVHGDEQAAVLAAFDLSYLRLHPPARRLFRLLGRAPGPDIGVPAVAALMGCENAEATSQLEALTTANLLVHSGSERYRFHDLLREYAATKTGDRVHGETLDDNVESAAMNRVLDHYLHTAAAATQLLDPDAAGVPLAVPVPGAEPRKLATEAAALEWLDSERTNLVAAAVRSPDYDLPHYSWQLAETLRDYFWARGNGLEGLAVCKAALAAASETGNQRARASVLNLTGLIHYGRSEYEKAAENHRRALDISREIGDLDGASSSLHNLGRVYSQLGEPEVCLHRHHEALDLARQIGNIEGQALNTNYIGVAHLGSGRPDLAVSWHEEALELARRLGNRSIITRVLNGLALAAWTRGDLDAAITRHLESIEIARHLGNRHAESSGLICLAEARCAAGQYDRAIADARLAIYQCFSSGERRHEVGGEEIIATARLRSGYTDGIVDDYQRALRLAYEINFGYGQISIHTALAAAYRSIDSPVQARLHAEQAIHRIQRVGLRVLETGALREHGHAHLELGSPRQALAQLTQALNLARQNGQRLEEARALHVYGLCVQATTGIDGARPYWQSAQEIYTDIGAPELAALRPLLTQA